MGLLRRIWGWLYTKQTPALVSAITAVRDIPPPNALDGLCERFACRYERSVFETGEVQITLIRNDATLSAVGLSTAAAVDAITVKATKCWGAL